MSHILSSVVFQTVISGTFVLVLGQMIQKSILDNYYAYRGVIGKIDNKLMLYLKIIKNPGKDAHPIERLQVASQELLQLSSDLSSCRKQLFFRTQKIDRKVSEVSELLYALHIGVFLRNDVNDQNLKKLQKIRSLLNLS